jgi:adenine-specific DNA-methyltransferase
MTLRRAERDSIQSADYRYSDTRKNNPPAGLAGQGRIQEIGKIRYEYDPHLPPVLRFDSSGVADQLPVLLAEAQERRLTADETKLLADALRNRLPWLEWAGKREKRWYEVDPVALHIHERVAAQAIIAAARREPVRRSLFADPELEYREAVKFYQHDVEWSNRLILGDSLTVMHSLARREDLAGKVQMIYIDPPYGIKFASNFQAKVGKRDVTDKAEDLTREPEQIKAYRDTWTLGTHSYLAYLRDRLFVAHELLTDSGSIFVQISDENLHRVRMLLDEVFGVENFVSAITFYKTTGQTTEKLPHTKDFILWYAKSQKDCKYRQLFLDKSIEQATEVAYDWLEEPQGYRRPIRTAERQNLKTLIESGHRVCLLGGLTSHSGGPTSQYAVKFRDKEYKPASGGWKTSQYGMKSLRESNRLEVKGNTIRYVRYVDDFPAKSLTDIWMDVSFGGFVSSEKIYVVQTATRVIERCILMTTDPGDLVLDPTCGSGTTAYAAEQWGRRWITIDTSRVAVALARQRLLTSKFDYYELEDSNRGVNGNFKYKTVAHIMLKSIAQNQALAPIFDRWQPVLEEKLAALNSALAATATAELRTQLQTKLAAKERQEGRSSITDADRRRWLLPKEQWQEWEVPFDSEPDWPEPLRRALDDYRRAWRNKMDEVNTTIEASAEPVTLVDQPRVVKNILRVSGPFTVEGVQPLEESFDLEDSPIGGEPEEMEAFEILQDPTNAEAYLDKMLRLLRLDGVRFPDNKVVKFTSLEPLPNSSTVHAEGEWETGGTIRRVAVSFGPQYGPLTAKQVEESLRFAYRRGYDDMLFAAFNIDGAAQALIQEDPNPAVNCHLAHIRPDVNIGGDLLKDTPSSQLFTVSGLPRVRLDINRDGEYIIHMEGVDIYDPIENSLIPTQASKVAAWFIDMDYNGQTFNISQAFFPANDAWEKIAKALKTAVDPERFAAFSGTVSLPFKAGEHGRAAVKVIDPRGNEVMKIVRLNGQVRYG